MAKRRRFDIASTTEPKVLVKRSTLTAIANAIRYWNGEPAAYLPSEMPTKILELNAKRHFPEILPDEYQRVQYLESTGGQAIDTGVMFESTGKSSYFDIILTVAYPRTSTNVVLGAYGGSTSTSTFQFDFSDGTPTKIFVIDGTGDQTASSITGLTADNSTFNRIRVNRLGTDLYLYLNDALQLHKTVSTASSLSKSLYMFASNGNGTYQTCKISECVIEILGERVRNFVPCYRKSDSKPGMYDTQEGVFYINAGSGADFTVGPDVNIFA